MIIIQSIVKTGLITEMSIPNYQSMFFFQINPISLIESEEFRETSIVSCVGGERLLWSEQV